MCVNTLIYSGIRIRVQWFITIRVLEVEVDSGSNSIRKPKSKPDRQPVEWKVKLEKNNWRCRLSRTNRTGRGTKEGPMQKQIVQEAGEG